MHATDQLRRGIKVMAFGQVTGREEMNREKRGYARLHPKHHTIKNMPLDALEDMTSIPKGKSGPSWRDFVPEGFEDKREEFLPEYQSRMKWMQLTHVKMSQVVRSNLLAYAFLRSVPYRKVEQKAFEPPKMDIFLEAVCAHIDTDKTRNEVVQDLASWLLDSTEEVPEDDWQSIPDMRYRLRNLSKGVHADTGLPRYEALKAEQKKAAKKAARTTAKAKQKLH